MLIVLCCHLQVNQSLVTTIHSNLFSQHSFGRPSRLYATGCHAKLFFFLIQGAFSNMRCLCPNIIRNSSGTNSQSWRLAQNVLLVRSKRSGNYGGGPTMDRQKILENECPRLVGIRGKWCRAHLQSTQPMKQENQKFSPQCLTQPTSLTPATSSESSCYADFVSPSHCTCLSVPSRFRPSWRPPRSMHEIRGTSKPRHSPPWSEQQPAFAEKLEPESPHTPLFQISTFPPSIASTTDVSKS